MGLLSASLLAELQSEVKSAFCVLELTLPSPSVGGSSSTHRFASVPVASRTLGQYTDKVVRWGKIRWAISDRSNNLQLSSTQVDIEDTSYTLASIIEGANAFDLRGSRAVIKLASNNVTSSNWFTLFDGYIDKWRQSSPLVWSFTLQWADQPLRGNFPKTPIMPADWPNADRALYGSFVPLIYGVHNSQGSTDKGSIPCLKVDSIGFRYLVAQGYVTPDRVYVDGVLQSAGYSVVRSTVGGRYYTLIDFTSNPGVDAAITADVTGYESVGNGSGSTLTGADALQHLLINFVYGDYQSGNWASVGTIPVSTTHFSAAQTFLTTMGWHKVSRRYGGGTEQTTGIDALNEWCQSKQMYCYFTNTGLIAVKCDDHRTTTLWHDAPRLVSYDRHEIGRSLDLDYSRDSITDRIAVQYVFDAAEGNYVQTVEVRDVSVGENVQTQLPLPWSHAALE